MAVSSEVQSILDSSAEPRLLIRDDYTVAYANPAFVQRYGRSDFVGLPCHEILFHRAKRCSECGDVCPLELASVSGKITDVLRRVLMPGGTQYMEIQSVPIKRADGLPVYFMETVRDRNGSAELLKSEGVVSRSASTRALLALIARIVVLDDWPVLFMGPSGAGKEVFGRLIHENSRRAAQAFLRIDCQTADEKVLSEELLNAFGTGLQGGTLYLSDVADLSASMQYAVMKLLETGRYVCAGGAMEKADIRLICATRHDLTALMREGKFREDLYYRLMVCRLTVPGLAERREDIPQLSEMVLKKFAPHRQFSLTQRAQAYLMSLPWPGNVRELEMTLERAAIFSQDDRIDLEDLSQTVLLSKEAPVVPRQPQKQAYMMSLINHWHGSRKELAQELGISVRTLYRLIKKYKAQQEDSRD